MSLLATVFDGIATRIAASDYLGEDCSQLVKRQPPYMGFAGLSLPYLAVE
jgi:hypothetical protein